MMQRRFTVAQDREIADAYTGGLCIRELVRRYGGTDGSVRAAVQRGGATIRPPAHPSRYPINENAFADVSPGSTASYFVGLLMADGCVRKSGKSYTISLRLSGEDGAHVLSFRDFLGAGHPISIVQPKHDHITIPGRGTHPITAQPRTGLVIASERLGTDLLRYGVVPRKSYCAEMRGGLHLCAEAWRGCVDGDGYVSIQTNRDGHDFPAIGLCGTRRITEQFADFVCHLVETAARPSLNRECWTFRLSGYPAYVVTRALYGHGGPALPRKARTAQEIIARFAGILPKTESEIRPRPWRLLWDHVTPKLLDEWLAKHGSWTAVVEAEGISLTQLYRLRHRLRHKVRPTQSWAHLTREEVVALHQQHGSWKRVAKALGMPCHTCITPVRRRLGLL